MLWVKIGSALWSASGRGRQGAEWRRQGLNYEWLTVGKRRRRTRLAPRLRSSRANARRASVGGGPHQDLSQANNW